MQGEAGASSAENVARTTLLADAGYCAGLGAGLVVVAERAGRVVSLPVWAIRVAGAATAAWGLGLAVVARAGDDRPRIGPLAGVAAANTVAAGGLALLGRTRPERAGRFLSYIIAGQVGGFALVQATVLALAARR